MKILGIETSCDETAVCIIETYGHFSDAKIKILGNQLYSQVALHAQYGGVFPNMAKREHAKNLVPLLEKCLTEAKLLKEKNQEISAEKNEKIKFDNLLFTIEAADKRRIQRVKVTIGENTAQPISKE